jgi:hypothetical protein
MSFRLMNQTNSPLLSRVCGPDMSVAERGCKIATEYAFFVRLPFNEGVPACYVCRICRPCVWTLEIRMLANEARTIRLVFRVWGMGLV